MADAMYWLYVILRFLHVGSAIFLVGGATLWSVLVVPAIVQMGPTLPKGAFPTIGKRVAEALPNAGVLTLLTGLAVFATIPGASGAAGTAWGMLIMLALLLTIVLVGISHGVLKPTFKKLGPAMMASQGPPTPEAQALIVKLTKASKATLAIGWLIVLLMVLATSHVLG